MREPSGVMATSRSAPLSVNAVDPDVVTVVRTTEGGSGARGEPREPSPATAATTSAPRRQRRDAPPQRSAWQRCGDAVPAAGARLAPLSSTNSAVEMSAIRCRRSLVRQR